MRSQEDSLEINSRESVIHIESRGRTVQVFSDLHLGPYPPLALPTELDPVLAGSMRETLREGGLLILNGDIFDEEQPVATPRQVLDSYPCLAAVLEHARRCRSLYYLSGNHDPNKLRVLHSLGWPAYDRLVLDDRALIMHGHQLDEYLRTGTKSLLDHVHLFTQRLLNARLQFPFAENASLRNRIYQSLTCTLFELMLRVGGRYRPAWARELKRFLDYLLHQELAIDPGWMLRNLSAAVLPEQYELVICGHSHLPGLARIGRRLYANSGTWSASHATTVRLRGGRVEVFDVLRGLRHGFEAYAQWHRTVDWPRWWRQEARHIHPRKALREALAALQRGLRLLVVTE